MILVFATSNAHKVAEIRRVLPETLEIRSLAEIGYTGELPETRDTIEANSLQKAEFLKAETGLDCFAEDTGLEVEGLDGDPGVYSARYAGDQRNSDDNMELLLHRMRKKKNRKARFRTVITLIIEGETHQFEGVLKGKIGQEKRGHYGFGYDPVFVLSDGRTLAQLSPREKARISHRAIATAALVEFLQKRYI